jgi:hypothetical protein
MELIWKWNMETVYGNVALSSEKTDRFINFFNSLQERFKTVQKNIRSNKSRNMHCKKKNTVKKFFSLIGRLISHKKTLEKFNALWGNNCFSIELSGDIIADQNFPVLLPVNNAD